MKQHSIFIVVLTLTVLSGCDDSKPVVEKKPQEPIGVAALKVPEYVPPPVETQPYEDGYAAGGKAGEADARSRKGRGTKKPTPSDDEIAVLALEAAGSNPERGPKWQQGFIAGYKYDFERITKGLR
jgi:hypothetical protein